MKVTRSLGTKALTKEGLLEELNRVIVPTVRELLRSFNAMTHETSFTSADLDSGTLTVEHGLSADIVAVTVADSAGLLRALPDETVEMVTTDELDIDLSSFTVTGTWRVLVQRG